MKINMDYGGTRTRNMAFRSHMRLWQGNHVKSYPVYLFHVTYRLSQQVGVF